MIYTHATAFVAERISIASPLYIFMVLLTVWLSWVSELYTVRSCRFTYMWNIMDVSDIRTEQSPIIIIVVDMIALFPITNGSRQMSSTRIIIP